MRARTRAGSPAMGMVMTLVIVVDEEDAEDAMQAARAASHEHPARVLGVILGDAPRPAESTPRWAPAPAGPARPH